MKRILVFFIIGVVFFGGCSAQSANAQNANIAQRIIGTWVNHTGEVTWLFNANGNLTIRYSDGITQGFRFGVTDSKLFYYDPADANGAFSNYSIYNISISSDGRTLILEGTQYSMDNRFNFGEQRRGYLLTKQ